MKPKLLIVADLGLLKAYKYEPKEEGSPRIQLLEEAVFQPAHQHITDQLSDSAGKRANPGGHMGGGTMSDKHNVEQEEKRRLIKQIVQKIESVCNTNNGDGCWLAAHKEILHSIFNALPKSVTSRIEQQIPRDITKMSPKEVLEHFLAARQ